MAGDAATARDQLAVVLPIRERVQGPHHPHTLATRHNLAYWTEKAGDLSLLAHSCSFTKQCSAPITQAVARLNATGQRSGDLVPYARESMRRAAMLTSAAEEVRKRAGEFTG
jgi:hypothetical protein